jgi:hypothetical protein
MSDKRNKGKAAKPPHDLPYEVGKWKPPVKHQFAPGRSGNPRGRPRGSKNIATQIAEVFCDPVMMMINGKQSNPPGIVAAAIIMLQKALSQNNDRARRDVLALGREMGLLRLDEAQTDTALETDDKAILESFLRRLMNSTGQTDEPKDAPGDSPENPDA